ncbi:GOLPH3/VPS74 family protein [Actinotalea solisilvae]|uniref:GOLPH3/VPS74 family protein n=1 Tax=Actinotalea solisilvae TaxID=2072922 RepID=UPI0018F20A97|nr:GPP34 family phosphoprotein [Actinotalea solisilvae]
MLLVDDLMLQLLDASGRTRADATRTGLGLAGALMLDLALRGKVDVAQPGERVKAGRLVVRDTTPTGDPLLDEALRTFAEREGRKPQDVLPKVAKGLKQRVLDRLVRLELVQHVEGRVLGVFPTHAYPRTFAHGSDATAEGIRAVVVTGHTPTEREAALISLLQAVDRIPAVVGDVGLTKRELRARAKAVAASGFASEAVRKAIEAVDAATTAAIAAAVASTAATAGS